jgi:hypothetical protein
MAVSIPKDPANSVTETPLITYQDQTADKLQFVPDVSQPYVGPLDFVNDSFYVELTLSQLVRVGAIPFYPPEVASIHLVAYPPLVDVPSVIGDIPAVAIGKLTAAGLNWEFVNSSGKYVTSQSPGYGDVPKGTTVELTLGNIAP